jgi:anti-sigma B factor antagonist
VGGYGFTNGTEGYASAAMHYTIDHDPIDGGHLVVASGELDVAAMPRLSTVLAMAGTGSGQRVVLDLMAVDFIDSTALGTILKAAGQLEEAGHTLAFVAPDGPVRRLLEMTNLTGRFRLHQTRAEALASSASTAAI